MFSMDSLRLHWHTVTEHTAMAHQTLVILGSGYTAKFVWPLASARYRCVLATSREPDRHLHEIAAGQRLQFDLSDTVTWRNIPERADLLWCFPAAPLELVKRFAETLNPLARRIVVLGSTSAYDVNGAQNYPPDWTDETAPIDLTKPRVQGEEFLRSHLGAVVLRVAGIYGPNRNPLEWIKTGRVGPSRKYVNLIHATDLAAICLTAVERGMPDETYNVSDGTPRTWKEICDTVETRWGITSPKPSPSDETGKCISNVKLIKTLNYSIQHPDLFKELASL
jgi:hypothetical protein